MVLARSAAESKTPLESNDPSQEDKRKIIGCYDRSKHLRTKHARIPAPWEKDFLEMATATLLHSAKAQGPVPSHCANRVIKEKCIPEGERNNDHSKCSSSPVFKDKCIPGGGDRSDDRSNHVVITDTCIPGGLRRVPLLKTPNHSSLFSRRMKSRGTKNNVEECNISDCTTVPEGSDQEFSSPEGTEFSPKNFQNASFKTPCWSVGNAVQDIKSASDASEHSKVPDNRRQCYLTKRERGATNASNTYAKQPKSYSEAKRFSSWHSLFFASHRKASIAFQGAF